MADGDEEKRDCVTHHTAMIYDRGGRRQVGPLLDLSYTKWERDRDDTSEGEVRVQGDSCSKQRDFLEGLRTHRHELAIFRDNERVWEGPLHRITVNRNDVRLIAHDCFEYLNGTPLTKEWSNAFPNITEVTTRLEQIIRYELTTSRQQVPVGGGAAITVPAWEQLDPPVNLIDHLKVHHWPNEARTSAVTKAFEMTVGEHIRNMARQAGVDFTMLGRALHLWDTSRSIGRINQLSDENFMANVIVTEYGADHAQSSYVIGNDGVYGDAVNVENLDYYGPWTTIFTSYNEEGTEAPEQSELRSQATRNLSGRSPAPVEVRIPDNSSIILTDSLQLKHLVPGVQVQLNATLNARPLDQLQKIDHVQVIETPAGEQIKVTLTPATRADSDQED